MNRTKSKKRVHQQISYIVGFLVVLQVLLIAYFNSKPKALTVSQAIDNAVSSISDPRRREQARLFAAIKSFQSEHGNLPGNLNELIPIYFEQLPLDPVTGKPFEYKIDGQKFYIGKDISNEQKSESVQNKEAESELAKIVSLEEQSKEDNFIYDPTDKRDPFLPFDFSPQIDLSHKSPLERFTLGQLKLTAVLKDFNGEPQAIVETSTGKGFNVKKGTKIGPDNGVIADIQPDKLIILETKTDFTGEQKNKTVELRLRTKDQENEQSNFTSGR